MPQEHYDRASEDLGNIVGIGHVNTRVPDQRLATAFYVSALGLTRDPFLNTGIDNMWINVGMSQFHLPTGEPDRLRGKTGLVVPDRERLLARLEGARRVLGGTQFDFREANDGIETTSPWGNRFTCHAPDEARFGRIVLGMPYVEFAVRPGTAASIARFYREVLGALTAVEDGVARVQTGERQYLYFRESDERELPYDGHHIQIYITDFSGPYRKLRDLGLITMETNRFEYRFTDIVDPDTRAVLFTVEHEVRSQTHPMFGRPLVNRNSAQTARDYRPGHDSMSWAIGV